MLNNDVSSCVCSLRVYGKYVEDILCLSLELVVLDGLCTLLSEVSDDT